MELAKILEPINIYFDEFERRYSEYLMSDSKFINDILEYSLNHKGKRIRPALVFLSARVCSPDKINEDDIERMIKSAILVELIHSASLMHDDVIDNSEYRRGSKTINSKWNNQTAILSGDYLLSKALQLASELGFDYTKLIITTFNQMCLGELYQLERVKDINLTEKEYFQNIKYKTGELLGACCALGAMSVNASDKQVESLRKFGENLGIAYQIKDDLIDYVYDVEVSGKSAFNDIKNKKVTLPLIHSLNSSLEQEKAELSRIFKNGEVTDESVLVITEIINKSNSVQYCKMISEKILNDSIKELNSLEPSPYKDSLQALCDFVRHRNY
ncbi:MAG: polyprenyl synthetase family protein [Candidatus Kapabacteria bacterium]|nr:polyprenyl synthetase family protein [Candidatus Kapabacteria bacterium]